MQSSGSSSNSPVQLSPIVVRTLHCAFFSRAAHWFQPDVTAGVDNDFPMLQSTVRKTLSLPPRRKAVPIRCAAARGTVQGHPECDLCEQALASQCLLLALW